MVLTVVSFTMTRWKKVKRISQGSPEDLNKENMQNYEREFIRLTHTIRG